MGIGNGALFMAFYASYGLAFWYGTKQASNNYCKPITPAVFSTALRGRSRFHTSWLMSTT